MSETFMVNAHADAQFWAAGSAIGIALTALFATLLYVPEWTVVGEGAPMLALFVAAGLFAAFAVTLTVVTSLSASRWVTVNAVARVRLLETQLASSASRRGWIASLRGKISGRGRSA